MNLKDHARRIWVAVYHRIRSLQATLSGWFSSRKARRVALAGIVVAIASLTLTRSVVRVREGEVGVLVNNMTGMTRVELRAGYHFVLPGVHTLYHLDRRVQSLTMAERSDAGFSGGDPVRIKTSDGSNVSLDTQVSYRLIPERAAEVLRDSGREYAFGNLWVRSAVRAMMGREFGKLTTEQLYEAAARNERAEAALKLLNQELEERGIEVVAVVPQEFRFYREYEEVIKSKKLADQEVEEQRAKAGLATQEQQKKVAESEFAKAAKIATAKGSAERTKAEADGYVDRLRLEAEAALATAQRQAEGRHAAGMAEAEGLRQGAEAMAGDGGISLVALEYARQLGNIQFSGVPVVQDGMMSQYRIHQASPAPLSIGAAAIGQGR